MTAEPRPRLRFDKVALRLVGGLRAALGARIPEGKTVLLTVTAPIRLPAKTAAALEEKISSCLAEPSAPSDIGGTIHGNRVRIRLVSGAPGRAPKLVGFMHNPETDPDALLDRAQWLLREIAAASSRQCLVIADDDGGRYLEAYRHVCSQLPAPTGFGKILLALPSGRLEPLTRPADSAPPDGAA